MKTLCAIIPAHDEATLIGNCLTSLLASEPLPDGWRADVLVVANGCTDNTAAIALGFRDRAAARGWNLTVIDEPEGGKLKALNIAEKAARGDVLVYLDADVTLDPPLIRQLAVALDRDEPGYASGRPDVVAAPSWLTGHYARFWASLPFAQTGVPGFGVFAMNAAGRARWGQWPDIISDDTFARLNFAPGERTRVGAAYRWPMVEGFANLVRVRRRQNDGVGEIATCFAPLLANDDKPRLTCAGLTRRVLRDPLGFATYLAVSLAVKSPFFRTDKPWARGR